MGPVMPTPGPEALIFIYLFILGRGDVIWGSDWLMRLHVPTSGEFLPPSIPGALHKESFARHFACN